MMMMTIHSFNQIQGNPFSEVSSKKETGSSQVNFLALMSSLENCVMQNPPLVLAKTVSQIERENSEGSETTNVSSNKSTTCASPSSPLEEAPFQTIDNEKLRERINQELESSIGTQDELSFECPKDSRSIELGEYQGFFFGDLEIKVDPSDELLIEEDNSEKIYPLNWNDDFFRLEARMEACPVANRHKHEGYFPANFGYPSHFEMGMQIPNMWMPNNHNHNYNNNNNNTANNYVYNNFESDGTRRRQNNEVKNRYYKRENQPPRFRRQFNKF